MPTSQPNILFLFPDQWRWDWLGCETSPYGDVPVRTPHIDALAQRGVRFTECRTNSPLCSPARACLATGVRYEQCGVPTNEYDVDPARTTVFQLLRNQGYRVGTCGKNDLHKKTKWKGRDGWTQLLGQYGFTEAIDQSGKLDAAHNGKTEHGGPHCSYTNYLHSLGMFDTHSEDYRRRAAEASAATAPWPSPLAREHYTDDFCGRMALQLLDGFPQEGPWMLWVNFPGPHDPFDPPRELQKRYDGITFPPPVDPSDTWRNHVGVDHQQLRQNYAACCEGIDEWVGRIIDAVAQRDELDNTIVIFSSDHGELLGDHGRFTKTTWHEGSVHVPLVVAGPGVDRGRVDNRLVELIDLSSTMLETAQIDQPDDWEARSVFGEPRKVQLSSLTVWRMAYDGRYKRVDTEGESPALYDLKENPQETENIAANHGDVMARLGAAMV